MRGLYCEPSSIGSIAPRVRRVGVKGFGDSHSSRGTRSRYFSPNISTHIYIPCPIHGNSLRDGFIARAGRAANDTKTAGKPEKFLSGGFSRMAEEARPGDIFVVTLDDGSKWYLEAIRAKKRSLRFVCQGELCRVTDDVLVSEGFYPKLSDSWVRRHPLLVSCLEEIRRLQKSGDIQLPSVRFPGLQQDARSYTVEFVTNMAEFEQEVRCDPKRWCNGTGPDDDDLLPIDQSLLSAGELLALLQGDRGVALLQLSLPADMGGNRLPLLRPFIFEIMKQIDERKDIVVYPSKISGGVASSLVIAAKRQPFTSWAVYLSGLGVQASIVAQSEFYKMIIGRMMGYRIENIEHHIRSTGGSLDPSIYNLVDKELATLSKVEPRIPWK